MPSLFQEGVTVYMLTEVRVGLGMTSRRPWVRGVLYSVLLYLGSYVVVRVTHGLVRNEEGCVSRPSGFLDPVLSCKKLEQIDRVRGRTSWQIVFRPLTLLEERLRGPARP